MQNLNVTRALKEIAGLIEGQRPAGLYHYEVVWIKDHFVCRRIRKANKGQYLLIELRARDINNDLAPMRWEILTHRLKVLIATGVIK